MNAICVRKAAPTRSTTFNKQPGNGKLENTSRQSDGKSDSTTQ